LIIIAASGNSFAQTTYDQLENDWAEAWAGTTFEFVDNIMPEVFSERSAVLTYVNYDLPTNITWKELSEEVHKTLRQAGIDAVAYYRVEDIFSGPEVKEAYKEDLQKRQINNLILLSYVKSNNVNVSNGLFSILITKFDAEKGFLSHGQPAWQADDPDLNNLLISLYRKAGVVNAERKNHLILERPEFFSDVNILKGQRFETYSKDLKIDKLAVPRFQMLPEPEQDISNEINREIINSISEYNLRVEELNAELENILADNYPYSYGLVEFEPGDENDLKNQGFQFIILPIYTKGITIKQFLDYNIDKSETDYISERRTEDGSLVLKTMPVEKPAYKYYVKHLITGDVFTGGKWDADETWQESLENYLRGIKAQIVN
jgi:hypothetical protein